MDNVLGTNTALVGLGVGVVATAGAVAWAASRRHDGETAPLRVPTPATGPAPHVPDGPAYADATDAPNTAASGIPAGADGPGNLAVAWWPQDISLTTRGNDATLRFQSTIANLGGEAVAVRPGDRLEYTIQRQDTRGNLGEVVGRGSAPLTRADTQPFPVAEGVEIGHAIQSFGARLEPISALAPQTAAIIGANHDMQAIRITGAREGLYALRQQIVRADGSTDDTPFDDERITELYIDGAGGIVHAASRYAG